MAKTRAKKKGAKAVKGPPANARLVRARAAKTAAADKAKKQKTTGTGSTGSKNPVKSNGGGRRKGGAAASTKTSAGRKTAGATSRSSGRKRKQRTASSTIAATAAAASVAASASTAIVAATTADFKVVKSTDTKSEVHDKITHNAIIVITIWTAEDEDNERCIKDGFCRGGTDSARRKELIARLYNQVYKKLPRTCLTKAGSKKKLNNLRARDYLSKNNGAHLNHLLSRSGIRKTLISGDNKGQISSDFANSNKFKIIAQDNLQEGKGVAASLNITEELTKDLISLAETGLSDTQQFDSFHSALLYVRDALKPIIPDIDKVVTLSPEKYLELCKNVDPNTAASKLLNALAQRDATSLRCQSGACLQVAVRCVSQRLYERRLRAVIKKDGTRDILSMIPGECLDPTCVGNQKQNDRDDCYLTFRSGGTYFYGLIDQSVYRLIKGSPGVGTSNQHTDEEEGMGYVPLGDEYFLGQKKLPSIDWKECKDANGKPTGKKYANYQYTFHYYSGGKQCSTTISVHQLGQLILRMHGGASRGPFMDAWLKATSFEGRTVDEAFPIKGRGNQTAAYACKTGIPLEDQSEIPDVDHCGPRHEWFCNSLWYTLNTNHSRNIRFTTTRNGDKYPGNGTNDFNFAHLIIEYVPSHQLPSSDIVKESTQSNGR